MFVDASALTAILNDEAESEAFLAVLRSQTGCLTSPLAVWEASVAVARKYGLSVEESAEAVERLLVRTRVEVQPIPAEARHLALDAFARYGKGRHPAALNFGDCFAYACARLAGAPLLYKGGDFAQTDIA